METESGDPGEQFAGGEEAGRDSGGALGQSPAPGRKAIRCTGCYEVIEEAELIEGRCPLCGRPYIPPRQVAPPAESFSQRYQGTGLGEAPPEAAAEVKPRSGTPILLAVGAGLIALAVAVGALAALGLIGGPAVTPTPYHTPNTVISKTAAPTLPQAAYQTLTYVQDPDFSATITVESTVTVSSQISAKAGSAGSHLEAAVSGGNEYGTLVLGRSTYEVYVTKGSFLTRLEPTGKWVTTPSMSYVIVVSPTTPLFDLGEPNQLRLSEETEREGVPVYHLTSSSAWRPDVMRLAMMGASALDQFQIQGGRLLPDHYTLDLYVTLDGAPVYAEYHAWVAAGDGTKVLSLDTYYTFTNVGQVGPIPSPSGL